jgi:hypothetical protein
VQGRCLALRADVVSFALDAECLLAAGFHLGHAIKCALGIGGLDQLLVLGLVAVKGGCVLALLQDECLALD